MSRSACQLLGLLNERPVLPLEELNPKLFTLVPDLSLVKVIFLLLKKNPNNYLIISSVIHASVAAKKKME